MLKRIIILIILTMFAYISFDFVSAAGPNVKCTGLPGCGTDGVGKTTISLLIGNFIQYIAVIAVIALMLSGMLYLISGGEEEKVNKAKKWIIWSLVGVLVSISAMGIIKALNAISILK